jgi:hypothetical protein
MKGKKKRGIIIWDHYSNPIIVSLEKENAKEFPGGEQGGAGKSLLKAGMAEVAGLLQAGAGHSPCVTPLDLVE